MPSTYPYVMNINVYACIFGYICYINLGIAVLQEGLPTICFGNFDDDNLDISLSNKVSA